MLPGKTLPDRGVESSAFTGVDWEALRARVASVSADAGKRADPRLILRERARSLASKPEGAQGSGRPSPVLYFGLAREEYGIEAGWVREVHQKRQVTSIPGTPSFVAGATSLRGHVISVVDIKRFLNLPEVGLSDKILFLSGEGMEFGILVDTVRGVETLARSQIRPVPQNLGGIRREFFEGITAEGRILMNGSRLLGADELRIDQGASRERGSDSGGRRA